MKRFVLGVIVLTLLAGPALYAGGKYADVKPVLEEMAKAFEQFVTGLEKAENADAVAVVLNAHTKATLAIAPKVKEIMKKYPELKDEKTHPEELKPLLDKMDELAKKLMGLFGKLGQYAKDPKVQDVMTRWEKAMKSLDDEEEKEE